MSVLLGCIADDLTGATDVAVTFSREGLSVLQVNGMPGAAPAVADADAIEELEATARPYLMLRHERTRALTGGQVAELRRRYPD